MSAALTARLPTVSIGDEGALDTEIKPALAEVWLDRDISWLDFNERVLAEALDQRTPLLERAKFLAIFTSNLDEFFMKRVAVLRESQAPDAAAFLDKLKAKLLPMLDQRAECFSKRIVPALAELGLHLHRWEELTANHKTECNEFFDREISPAVTPLVIDSAENFPFLSNLSTSLVFALDDPETGEHLYARVKVPTGVRNWVQLHRDLAPDQLLFVRLHEIIRENLSKLYPGMKIGPATLVRLTRDAQVEADESEKRSKLEQVRDQVKKRRFEPVVRLEFTEGADHAIRELLSAHFQLLPRDIFEIAGELDCTTLFELSGLRIPSATDPPWNPVTPPSLRDGHADIFGVIRAGDLLVHHPYESFEASVEHFIKAASEDPQVVSVKMTVYRIGDDTPFVHSLIRAAEAGKQVACVIELNARFDEERNLHWAAALEKAGAHVSFGVRGLKTHGKTALVVRKEATGLRAYAHIGTGNYHFRTARLYADVGLFTCDPHLTQDVISLFHHLTGHSHGPKSKALLLAPVNMRTRFLELIHREIENLRSGRPARVIAKLNQLEDPDIIEALCEASRAGVPVDLIIRGFCCLKPGVPGLTENIRIRSIIGRFLEHSRIYHFANGHEQPVKGEFYIGSADWMFRNLSKRIEVVTPVTSPGPKRRLAEILDIALRDQRQAWVLGPDGSYSRIAPGDPDAPESLGMHRQLMDLALRA